MKGRINAIVDPKTGNIIEQIPMPPFENLAFRGGGFACIAYGGVITALEESGLLAGVKRVSGVSGGAIAALGVCLGYTGAEIIEILKEMPTHEFKETTESWWFTPPTIAALAEAYRFFSSFRTKKVEEGAEKYRKWLQSLVARKFGNPHATTDDLLRRIESDMQTKGCSDFKEIIVSAVKLSAQVSRQKNFGSASSECIELAQAVFMSSCHPALWGATEWNNSIYTDGGAKSNILMDVFDNEAFYPKDYKIPPGRKNPATLGIILGTPDELNEIMYNEEHHVPVDTATQLATRVALAMTDTVDINEIQFQRNIIAVSDCNVNRLNSNISVEKRIELFENAHKTTWEFLENHLDAAYSFNCYKGRKAWFAAQKPSNLLRIRNIYADMLKTVHPEDTEEQHRLQEQIDYIDHYSENNQITDCPPHINIYPECTLSSWHAVTRKRLNDRLLSIREKLSVVSDEYQYLNDHYAWKMSEIFPEVNYGWRCEEALHIMLCGEYMHKLERERDEVECKLGLQCAHHIKPDVNNSKAYELLYQKMRELIKKSNHSYALQAVLVRTLPFIQLREEGPVSYELELDLRNAIDRRLYLIAALIYLEMHKCQELPVFKEIVKAYIPEFEIMAVNFEVLVKILRLSPIEAHVALFKLEGLLHVFERHYYPGYKPSLEIDKLYHLPSGTFFKKPTESIPASQWLIRDLNWEENQTKKMDMLQENINRATAERERMAVYLRDCLSSEAVSEYFHGEYNEVIQLLAVYDEFIKNWISERNTMQCQLQINCQHEHSLAGFQQQMYATFFAKMITLNADTNISYGLRAVLIKQMPIAEFTEMKTFPFKFQLDFRLEHDRKLYLIAGMLYLEYRRYHDIKMFKEIYQMFLLSHDAAPKSKTEIAEILGDDCVALQLSLQKIESLLRCFEMNEYPDYKSVLNIDDFFKLPRLNFYNKPVVNAVKEIELKPMYQLSEPKIKHIDFVERMADYSDHHPHEFGDSPLCEMVKQWRMQ